MHPRANPHPGLASSRGSRAQHRNKEVQSKMTPHCTGTQPASPSNPLLRRPLQELRQRRRKRHQEAISAQVSWGISQVSALRCR
jgi:hypothetical protein